MSNIDQMVENVRLARLRVKELTEELRAKGVVIHDYDYGIDPATGQVTNLSITVVDGFSQEDVASAYARLRESNILRDGLCHVGIGTMLRNLPRDPDNLAFKLHDFGFRRGENS